MDDAAFREAKALIKISVIIPHYDDLANLSRCLDLLDLQTLERSQYEIIVVDNDSKAGLAAVKAVVRERGRVLIETEKGAGPARNRGVEEARGTVLAFIDSDCRPKAGWLEAGVTALALAPIVGGPVLIEPENQESMTGAEAFDVVFGFDALHFMRRHGFIGSGNLFVRRQVFQHVGGFRSGVSEDVEWSRRAVGMGFNLSFASGAVVAHPAWRDWDELVRKWDKHTRESFFLVREMPFGTLFWLFKAWLVLASPFLHAIKIAQCRRVLSWRHRLAGIGVLFRIRFHRFVEAHRIVFKAPLTFPLKT